VFSTDNEILFELKCICFGITWPARGIEPLFELFLKGCLRSAKKASGESPVTLLIFYVI
jgi:hypothetical protein